MFLFYVCLLVLYVLYIIIIKKKITIQINAHYYLHPYLYAPDNKRFMAEELS